MTLKAIDTGPVRDFEPETCPKQKGSASPRRAGPESAITASCTWASAGTCSAPTSTMPERLEAFVSTAHIRITRRPKPRSRSTEARRSTRSARLFPVDERLQLVDVRFVQVSEKRHVVRTGDEPYGQHHVSREEAIGPYDHADQLAMVEQHILDPAQPVPGLAEHHILTSVDLDLACRLVGNLLLWRQTDAAGQDVSLFEGRLLHRQRLGPIAEVERLAADLGPRHRESDEIMRGGLDCRDRDHNLVGGE